MTPCSLAKIESRLKGYYVYNNAFKVGEILNWSIENDNEYIENTIVVFSSSKKSVGHITKPLAKIVFSQMKCWKILEVKVEISE